MSTQKHHLTSNEMSEVFNNPLAQEIRQRMLEGEYHATCSECSEREQLGLHSDRDMYDDWHREAEKHTDLAPLDTVMPEPIWADIRPSNLCNLKCRMCFPDNSTEIAREEAGMKYEDRPNRNTDQELAVLSQRKHYKLPELNRVINLKLLGGEPTVQQEVFEILENTEYHENSLLSITTNASNVTQYKRIMPLVKKFAQVKWGISIDGYRAGYEYIRTPGRWDSFNEAVEYLSNTHAGRINTMISFNYCIQMWNYSNTPETLQYCEAIGQSIKERLWAGGSDIRYGGVHMNTVSQDHLKIKLIPEVIKRYILDYARELNISEENYNKLKSVSSETEHNDRLVERFLQHTDIMDKTRKTRFDTIDPALMARLRTVKD